MDTTRYTYAGTDLKPQVVKGLTEREKQRRHSEVLWEYLTAQTTRGAADEHDEHVRAHLDFARRLEGRGWWRRDGKHGAMRWRPRWPGR